MRKLAALGAVAVMGLALTEPAEALSTWGGGVPDNALVFPGWENVAYYGNDPWGVPDFKFYSFAQPAMRVEGTYDEVTKNRYLNRVTFWYGSNTGSLWDKLVPGDLFIDLHAGVSGDGWNYIVDLQQDDSKDLGARVAGNYSVYSLSNLSYTAGGTVANNPYFDQANNAEFYGYLTRAPHPWGIEDATNDGVPDYGTDTGVDAYWDGWKNWVNSSTPLSSSFFFGAGTAGLNLGSFLSTGIENISIGFTVSCANDVVYDKFSMPKGGNDIPEPGTVLLLGTGIIGLLGLSRPRRRTVTA